ncbi:PCS3 [Symbiodinium pilosum]|uniref:glutathione gamma-glutamylcysteinyltransferase n=1 Tax=Symbiodinium pilosum TaxID=2952 RepID=A0A812SBB7_SYMPI|nr:PCS3 [Symbiodinium pilosum]
MFGVVLVQDRANPGGGERGRSRWIAQGIASFFQYFVVSWRIASCIMLLGAGDAQESTLRADIAAALQPSPSFGSKRPFLLVNYSRSAIGQRMFSGGHYAPIAGYNAKEDKVLLLEVNCWRYPSVWVDLPSLWLAIQTQVANGNWRGYLRIRTP